MSEPLQRRVPGTHLPSEAYRNRVQPAAPLREVGWFEPFTPITPQTATTDLTTDPATHVLPEVPGTMALDEAVREDDTQVLPAVREDDSTAETDLLPRIGRLIDVGFADRLIDNVHRLYGSPGQS